MQVVSFYEAQSGKLRETLVTDRNDTQQLWTWGQDIRPEFVPRH
jgi:hypothetical protein